MKEGGGKGSAGKLVGGRRRKREGGVDRRGNGRKGKGGRGDKQGAKEDKGA